MDDGERKKNAKLIIQNKLKNLIDGPQNKREQFLKQVNEIKIKKSLITSATDIKQINRQKADSWSIVSPTLRSLTKIKNQKYSEFVSKRREELDLENYKVNIFEANKWEIIKQRKGEML